MLNYERNIYDRIHKKAKEILKDGSFTLVLTDGEKTLTSHDRGVKPLLELLEKGGDYSSFSAADKVVGSAAAYLYVLLKPQEVYALTMSEKAKAVFEKYGIIFEAECIVPAIINRKGDGFCLWSRLLQVLRLRKMLSSG